MALGKRLWEVKGGLWPENRGSGQLRDPSGESGGGSVAANGKVRRLGMANANLQRVWDHKREFTASMGSQMRIDSTFGITNANF